MSYDLVACIIVAGYVMLGGQVTVRGSIGWGGGAGADIVGLRMGNMSRQRGQGDNADGG